MSKDWKTRTQLVHEGSRRSQYGEMAEAIFLTQGFVYPTAEAAEARGPPAGAERAASMAASSDLRVSPWFLSTWPMDALLSVAARMNIRREDHMPWIDWVSLLITEA